MTGIETIRREIGRRLARRAAKSPQPAFSESGVSAEDQMRRSSSAVLCGLCRRVYTIEQHKGLLAEAEKRLLDLRLTNFTAIAGDGARGWPDQAPFERIIVTAAPRKIPTALIDQLADDGIMIIPVGAELEDQWLERVRKRDGKIERDRMAPVRFVPLVTAAPL